MTLRVEAPAKINRELRVGRLRPDGFHEIRSRMVSIDVCDTLDIEPAENLELLCSGLEVPADETNLVARAARALAARLGVPARARIRLEKRIAVGSGLGGGSADAAVALMALSRLWGARLEPEELGELASTLGSDVPFFLFGGEAQSSGRGERIAPLPDGPETELLLLIPPFPISTREVYEAHSRRAGASAVLPAGLEVETSGRFLGPNDLASAVLEIHPEMEIYLRSAREVSDEVAITGSGCAVVLAGASPEAPASLTRNLPGAALVRTRTLSRGQYRRRTSS